MKRFGWLAGVALVVGAPAAAIDQQAELKRFDEALRAHDSIKAARIADALIEARRPADKTLRTDPVLNAVLGRLSLAHGAYIARAFLERADLDAIPQDMRAEAGLALAAAQEMTGDFQAAEASLARMAGAAMNARQERKHALARARLALMSDPGRAQVRARVLAASARNPGERWEPEWIEAAALSLTGDAGAARAASLRAWSDAAEAPAADVAPVRVALLRAALASGTDERVAMLDVAKAADNPIDGNAVSDGLPQCGSDIGPKDFATFAAYVDNGSVHLAPVRASRTGVVTLLTRSVRLNDLFASTSDSAGGALFTVRCRTMTSAAYKPARWRTEPLLDWAISRGIYASPIDDGEADVSTLEGRVAALSARYGPDSPHLISLLDRLARQKVVEGADASSMEVRALEARYRALIRRAGGADGLIPEDKQIASIEALASGAPSDDAKAGAQKALAAIIERAPRDQAYEGADLVFNAPPGSGVDTAVRRGLAEHLLRRFPAGEADLRRQALLVRLAGLERNDDNVAAAQSWLRVAGAPIDLCSLADEPPQLTKMGITDDDYPTILVEHSVEGTTTVEYDVGANGRVAASRLIVSSPAGLFDDTVTRELTDFESSPAVVGGKPTACSGVVQVVRWRLPSDAGGPTEAGESGIQKLINQLKQPETGPGKNGKDASSSTSGG